MADDKKSEILTVIIEKDPDDEAKCIVRQSFRANRGSEVEFQFAEEPDAEILFLKGTPFAAPKFKLGKQTVRTDASTGLYDYRITWDLKTHKSEKSGGSGASSGEVPDRSG